MNPIKVTLIWEGVKSMSNISKARIYTRTGDKGRTRLVDGSTVEKFAPRVEAYGTVDELNSYIGVIRSLVSQNSDFLRLNEFLENTQNLLFNVGSLLATEKDDVFKTLPLISEEHIKTLESEIDELNAVIPDLRFFILPTGHLISSHLHYARTICRRAERRTTELALNDSRLENCLKYLNRLSDYLFIAARWVNHSQNIPENAWKKI